MKFAVAAAATAALAGVASAATCTSTQQASAYTTLASLLTLSSFQGCTDDSGYSLLYSTSLPSDEEYVGMCASDNCVSLLSSVLSLNPPDCDLTVPTSGLVLNVYSLASGFDAKCASISTPATDAPSTTTAAPSTTTTPSTTTATPSTTTSPSVTTATPAAC
jgi:opacity protein-like surface antigen